MSRRIPASERTREGLRDLIDGRLSSGSGRSELVKLATWLTIEEQLQAEIRDDLGRENYEHGSNLGVAKSLTRKFTSLSKALRGDAT